MKYIEFLKKLSKNEIGGAYLFYGEEALLIEKTVDFIIKKYIPENFLVLNYTSLSGKNTNLEEIYSALETIPFMNDKRVVLLDEISEFQKLNNLDEDFYNLLDNLQNSTIAIFLDKENGLKKNLKLFKYFKKNGTEVEFEKLDDAGIKRFISNSVKSKNKKIENAEIYYFLNRIGYQNKKLEINLYEIENELNKVINATKGETITREKIEKVIEENTDLNIFDLLENLSRKDTEKTLLCLYELYSKDEPAAVILHMISRRYRHIYEHIVLTEKNLPEKEKLKIMGISEYEYRNIKKYRYDKREIIEALRKIMQVEILLKSTTNDELMLLEYLVTVLIKICK